MKHFSKLEFACKCGCGFDDISDELATKLDRARGAAGVQFTITSGCRCKEHNKKVGGVADSAHMKGFAADIAVNDKSKEVILSALQKEFRRIGLADNFIHVDVDPTKPAAMWFYR